MARPADEASEGAPSASAAVGAAGAAGDATSGGGGGGRGRSGRIKAVGFGSTRRFSADRRRRRCMCCTLGTTITLVLLLVATSELTPVCEKHGAGSKQPRLCCACLGVARVCGRRARGTLCARGSRVTAASQNTGRRYMEDCSLASEFYRSVAEQPTRSRSHSQRSWCLRLFGAWHQGTTRTSKIISK